MQIIEIEINKIKPDPNQPRTSVDETDLREMAQSIVTEGVINPIEVDDKFVIITGERRWRAAKLAGKTTVPAKILKIDKDDRFMRQVVENIHHNTMSDWDTANAIKKLLETWWPKEQARLSHARLKKSSQLSGLMESANEEDKGYTWLGQKIGKSRFYIAEKMGIFEQSKRFQEKVKKEELSAGFTRVIGRVPKEYKKVMEDKILNNEFRTRDIALEVANALKREEGNDSNIKKLINLDYSDFQHVGEAEQKIWEISPRVSDRVKKSYEPVQELTRIANELRDWVQIHPKKKIGMVHAARAVVNMNYIKSLAEEWFTGREAQETNLLGKAKE